MRGTRLPLHATTPKKSCPLLALIKRDLRRTSASQATTQYTKHSAKQDQYINSTFRRGYSPNASLDSNIELDYGESLSSKFSSLPLPESCVSQHLLSLPVHQPQRLRWLQSLSLNSFSP